MEDRVDPPGKEPLRPTGGLQNISRNPLLWFPLDALLSETAMVDRGSFHPLRCGPGREAFIGEGRIAGSPVLHQPTLVPLAVLLPPVGALGVTQCRHGVEVGVVPVQVVAIPVNDHAKHHKLTHPFPGELNLFLMRQFPGKRDVKLTRKLSILALLDQFDRVPKPWAVRHPDVCTCGKANLGMIHPTLPGKIKSQSGAKVEDHAPGAIGGRRSGTAP